ncbi:pol protein [Metarhizium acridum CQMa 102]|uniref:RNA-directed DNA polymerase n=1 Tax=Metarhizium acridum (strain CQMa 102) TaxID=655827 RepID=E9E9U8_METAQ|nr:pol protein [Metarhizium acridum CQMa 102]EFY87299.1 pol protein [Metarhizium acridum CQMa 102]
MNVFARWRPLADAEEAQGAINYTTSHNSPLLSVSIHRASSPDDRTWESPAAFTAVLDAQDDNTAVYTRVVQPGIARVLQGESASFFAYGHSGSGKTHTVMGYQQTPSGVGLSLAAAARHRPQPPGAPRQGPDGKTHIRARTETLDGSRVRGRPLLQRACRTYESFCDELQRGLARRAVGSSTVHDQNSRTHAVLRLEVVKQNLVAAREALLDRQSELVPVGKRATGISIEEQSRAYIRAADGKWAPNPEYAVDQARIVAALAEQAEFEARVEAAEQHVAAVYEDTAGLGGSLVFVDLAGGREAVPAGEAGGPSDQHGSPGAEGGDPRVYGALVGAATNHGVVDMEIAQLLVDIQGTKHRVTLDITVISKHDVILGIPWLRASNPRVNWRTGQLQWDLPGCGYEAESGLRRAPHSNYDRPLGIYVIAREPKAETTEIPKEYSKYSKLFSGELETGLPEHSRWDHEIRLQPGTEPTFNKIYPQNPEQDKALKEYLEDMLQKGYIRPSESPAGYPILWVPKKNGKLRPCIDYRHLNKITIKNRYPLPLMTEIRDKVGKAKWFTTLDLKGAYNLIRMKEGHEWMTAFRTSRGHYEYLVMPFGLTNAPATFQRMIDTILRKQLGVFVVVYLDDILIYSDTLEEHKRHVHEVLQTLQDNKLLVEASKCQFHQNTVHFLGYVLTHGEIRMSPDKIKTIKEWPTPKNLKEVRGFTAFVNFYRKFLSGYGDISRPLTNLTKKEVGFQWNEPEATAFQKMKDLVTSEPVLKAPDQDKPYELETDASDFALGGQLGQRDDQGRLHPVAFFSKKLHGPELNYGIHDKELMAIIECFKEWRHYLIGAKHQIKVYTDHKNLTSFLTTKDLNKRQIRWMGTLC